MNRPGVIRASGNSGTVQTAAEAVRHTFPPIKQATEQSIGALRDT